MKQDWKRFIALFMAISMVLVSGVVVTNSAFRASDIDIAEVAEEPEFDGEVGDVTTDSSIVVPEEVQEVPTDEGIGSNESVAELEDTVIDVGDEMDVAALEEPIEDIGVLGMEGDTAKVDITFNSNGAPVSVPTEVEGEVIDEFDVKIKLPSLEGWHEDSTDRYVKFIGWATNAKTDFEDKSVMKPNTECVVENGSTLYAIWSIPVRFFLEDYTTDFVWSEIFEVTLGGRKTVELPVPPETEVQSALGKAWFIMMMQKFTGTGGMVIQDEWDSISYGKPYTIKSEIPYYNGMTQAQVFYFRFNANANGDPSVTGMPMDMSFGTEEGQGYDRYESRAIHDFTSETPSRDHYTYYRWNSSPDDKGRVFKPHDKYVFLQDKEVVEREGYVGLYDDVVTAYAQWIPHAFVDFDANANGESVIVPEEEDQEGNFNENTGIVTYQPISKEKINFKPERTGYIFMGWSMDQGGSQMVIGDEITPASSELNGPVSRYTLYAQWRRIGDIQIVANNGNTVYDGANHSSEEVGIGTILVGNTSHTYTKSGNTYTLDNGMVLEANIAVKVAEAEAKDVGNYTTKVEIGNWTIKDTDGSDATQFYTMKDPQNGTYTITPMEVTMKSLSDSKSYDGTELTAKGWEVEPKLASGDNFTVDFTGKQIIIGESQNTYNFAFAEGTKAGNYKLNKEYGILTVEGPENPLYVINISGKHDSVTYDTDKHTVDEYTINGQDAEFGFGGTFKNLVFGTFTGKQYPSFEIEHADGTVEKYSIQVEVKAAEGKDADTYIEEITGYKITKNGKEVTDQFKVNVTNGSLEIKKAPVTLTAPSGSKEYDGEELKSDNPEDIAISGEIKEIFKKDGWNNYEYIIEGSQTEVGASPNRLTVNHVSGPDNYDITVVNGNLEVTGNTQYVVDIYANSSDGNVYNGEYVTVSGFYLNNANGSKALSIASEEDGSSSITYVGEDGNTFTITGLSASLSEKDAGTHTVELKGTPVAKNKSGQNVTGKQVTIRLHDGSLVIKPAKATVTSATLSKEYDGDPLTNGNEPLKQEGFFGNDGVEGTSFTGYQKEVGTSSNIFEYGAKGDTKLSNYDIEKVEGTLTVRNREAKYDVAIHGKSLSEKFDGTTKSVEGFIEKEGAYGYEVSVGGKNYYVSGPTSLASGINVTNEKTTVGGNIIVKDADGNVVTDQFNVDVIPGDFVITAREVKLTSATLDKEYDTKPLTNGDEELIISGDGFIEGDGVAANFTASITEPGSVPNEFTYKLNEGTLESNYVITKEEGQLTVKDRDVKYTLILHPVSGSREYNGEEFTVEGFKEPGNSDAGYEVEFEGEKFYVQNVSSQKTGINVSDTGAIPFVTGGYKVVDSKGKDVTNQFGVDVDAPGQFEITKRPATITSATDTKEYDGTALTNDTVTMSGFLNGDEEEVTVTVTGTVTYPETVDNEFTYAASSLVESNYKIEKVLGTLTVINRETKYEITLTGNSDKVVYDGREHTVSGFDGKDKEPRGGYSKDVVVNPETGETKTFYVKNVTSEWTAEHVSQSNSEIPVVRDNLQVLDEDGRDVTSQFKVITKPGSLIIEKAPVTLIAPSASKEYDEEDIVVTHADELGEDDIVAEGDNGRLFDSKRNGGRDSYAYKLTGEQTSIGSSNYVLEVSHIEGTEDNFDITVIPGTLQVTGDTEYEVTITANSGKKEHYDGEKVEVTGFTLKNDNVGKTTSYSNENNEITYIYTTDKGSEVVYTITGLSAREERTDAGTSIVTLEGTAKVTNKSGDDVTDKFNINKENGSIVIGKRPVTITAKSDKKEYDKTPLTNNGYTVDGVIEGEEITATVTGSITLPGTEPNVVTAWNAGNEKTKLENYEINPIPGVLEVIDRTAKYDIELTAKSYDGFYNGQTQSVEGFVEEYVEGFGYKVTADGDTFYVSNVSASASGKDVSDSKPVVPSTQGYIVKDSNGNIVTNSFNLSTNNGQFTIKKQPVTVKSQKNEKVFDGEPLTNADIETGEQRPLEMSGFAEGEGVTTNFTASITDPGTVANTYGELVPYANTNLNNYDITRLEGDLIVTPSEEAFELTITAKSGEKVYDGTPLTVTGFENETDKGVEVTFKNRVYYVNNVTSSGQGTNVSESGPVGYSTEGYVVTNEAGDVVSDNFSIKVNQGSLTIHKRPAYVLSQDQTRPFNGKPLTNVDINTIDVEGVEEAQLPLIHEPKSEDRGFIEGQEVTATFTAKVLQNSAPNTYENVVAANSQTILENYDIEELEGTLTVTKGEYTVTLDANSNEGTYTGSPIVAEGFMQNYVDGKGYEVKIGDDTYYITGVESIKEGINVSDSGPVIPNTENAKVFTAAGEEVTDNFTVLANPGTLTINRATLTLKSASASKEYDGNALIKHEMEIEDGWVDGEGATYNYSGSQIYVGTSWNGYSIVPNTGTNLNNYKLNKEFGRLKVFDDGTNPNDPANPESPKDDENDTHNPYGSVSKYATDHKIYNEGEVIEFDIIAKNIYATPMNVTFEEKAGVFFDKDLTTTEATIENVAPGGDAIVSAFHKLTAADIDGDTGDYYNKVIARFTKVPGSDVTPSEPDVEPENPENPEEPENPENPDNPDVPEVTPKDNGDNPDKQPPLDPPEEPDEGGTYEDDDDVPVFIENPSINIRKEAVTKLAELGDLITYNLVVTNNGNVDLNNVKVEDDVYNDGTVDFSKTIDIAKGEIKTVTLEYRVTEKDVEAGSVHNVAIASAKDPRDPESIPEGSDGTISSTDDEDVNIVNEFTITVHYVDVNRNTIRGDFTGTAKYKEEFRISNPTITGYNIQSVEVGDNELFAEENVLKTIAGIMPAKDIELTVVYSIIPADTTPEDPEIPADGTPGTTPDTPDTPGTTPTTTPTEGTVVDVDGDGNLALRAVEDIDTALANMDLGHLCNILYFLILFSTTVAFAMYCRSTKKHTARIYEIRSELGEDDPYREEERVR